jgi:hypothetical protein
MRATLPQTLRERRRSRADEHKRKPAAALAAPPVSMPVSDRAVERVRSAGGPIDEAAYVCECGLSFRAPVSTTVACPHCGAPQAW